MCDPLTLTLMAVGTGISAYGKISAGNATADNDALQSRIYSASADLLGTQAEIAKSGVDLAYARGRLEEGRIIENGRQVMADQHLYFASNNLDPSYGSPVVMAARTASRVQTDIELNRAGEAVAAADAMTKVANIEGQGLTARGNAAGATSRGIGAEQAGYFGAATDLLKGASSAFTGFGRPGPGGGSLGSGGMGLPAGNATGGLY